MNRFVFRIALLSLACALLIGARPAQAQDATAKVTGTITLVSPTGTLVIITSKVGIPTPLIVKSTTTIMLNGKPTNGVGLFLSWALTTKIGGTEPATAVFVPGLETAISITATTVVTKP